VRPFFVIASYSIRMDKSSPPKREKKVYSAAVHQSNPAEQLAKCIIAAGTTGAIAVAMRSILANLPPGSKQANTLTKSGLQYVRQQLLTQHAGAIAAMDEILREAAEVTSDVHVPVQAMDTTELYGAERPKTTGRNLDKYEDVKEEAAIFTYDVLQQTPEVLAEDLDQCHYEETREERPTTKNAAGVWRTAPRVLDADKSLEATMKRGFYTYVFQPEEVVIEITPDEYVVVDDAGKPAAIIKQETGDILTGDVLNKRVNANAKKFKRTGLFGTSDFMPSMVEYITPKLDGEPMYLKVNDGVGAGFDRKGASYKIKMRGRLEGRKGKRSIKMLVEWVPKIGPGARVYLLHAWQFGTPNNVGHAYTRRLLEIKDIKVSWPKGDYMYGLQKRKTYEGAISPLLLPVFGEQSDGIVLHHGNSQRYLKPYKTVDVKKQDTIDTLEKNYNVEFNRKYPGRISEYGISLKLLPEGKTRILFTFIRFRPDKLYENQIDNIIDLLTSADFDAWFGELDDRIENGDLAQPPGWEDYREFVETRNTTTPTTYSK